MRILSALCLTALTALPAHAQSIGGDYAVTGANPNGSTYGGTARIVLTSDVTCEIFWTTGNTTSSGICMRSGAVFVAGYELSGKVGLIIYDVQPDGSLNGAWTVGGQAGVGGELLTPM